MGTGVDAEGWGALIELRDQLAPGEKVGWWVVYNGDELRSDGSQNTSEDTNRDVCP